MIRIRFTIALLCCLLGAGTALASWYDDYDAGLAAARKGNWAVVVQKMTAAIRGNPNEGDKTRTYGAIFISYHPYYYRGIANLNLGNFEAAVADLEKASGRGELDLGSIETQMQRAKAKIEANNTPEPQPPTPTPAPQPRVPVPLPPPAPAPMPVPVPATPAMDPALRQRATAAIGEAKQHLGAAAARKATATVQYGQAATAIADATLRLSTARTNDDLNAVIGIADAAQTYADAAQPPAIAATPAPAPPTRPTAATDAILSDTKTRLRRALTNYFAGEFDDATRDFRQLTSDMPNNAWVWAFLGASQYSLYAFEADPQYRDAAMASFRKAKQLRKWNGGLPDKYFSKRIRAVFASAG
jgi:tetratricopeptide (TPR) repeat protein